MVTPAPPSGPGPGTLDDGDVGVAEQPNRLVGEPLRGGMGQVEAARVVAAPSSGSLDLPGFKIDGGGRDEAGQIPG
jgi:hypothetical protein